ncbi:MAG TPA: TetR/AcrR family transcriptional regulator [Vineibacter sp.]|nr:TetR/AcrR family transcriptional regulator [Vineibacter sp.]
MDTDQLVIESTTAPNARVRRPEDREREIVQAALELFVARGFAATKLDDVARAARVSKGLPYLYFRSKEELFKAVIGEAILGPLHSGEDLVASFGGTTDELLREIVRRFHAFNETPAGGVFKLVVAEAGNFPDVARYFVDEIERRGLKLFIAVLRRGIARGEIRPLADIESAAILLRAPLGMYAIWRWSLAPHTPPDVPPESFFAAYIDILLKGLRP